MEKVKKAVHCCDSMPPYLGKVLVKHLGSLAVSRFKLGEPVQILDL